MTQAIPRSQSARTTSCGLLNFVNEMRAPPIHPLFSRLANCSSILLNLRQHSFRNGNLRATFRWQELLGVVDRVQSVSQYSVSSCGQFLLGCGKVAPDQFSQTNDQIQAQLLPFTDGIIASTAPSNDPTFFSFSSTADPGKPVPLAACKQEAS